MRCMNVRGLAAIAAGLAVAGCNQPYVHLALIPSQPTKAGLGKVVAVDAHSDEAARVRLSVRGGSLATLSGAPTKSAICHPLLDGEMDGLYVAQPDNFEALVTAELVAADGECAEATPAGPAAVIVVSAETPTPLKEEGARKPVAAALVAAAVTVEAVEAVEAAAPAATVGREVERERAGATRTHCCGARSRGHL
jgi:hypothetical protein